MHSIKWRIQTIHCGCSSPNIAIKVKQLNLCGYDQELLHRNKGQQALYNKTKTRHNPSPQRKGENTVHLFKNWGKRKISNIQKYTAIIRLVGGRYM